MRLPEVILHPTDFSPTADRAGALAGGLANAFSARLELLHALESRGLWATDEATREGVLAARRTAAQASLERRQGEVGVAARAQVVTGVLAGPVILEQAQRGNVDLVVMGRDGEAAGRRPMGSVADEVVRFAGCPVLVVPSGGATPRWPPRRIVVPVDFSPASRRAVEAAAAWSKRLAAELDLLHVIEIPALPEVYAPAAGLWGPELRDVEGKAREALLALATEVAPGQGVTAHVAHGRAGSEIVAYAAERAADLLVLANHGLTMLGRLLLGTTAEEVVRQAAVPVLVVRGDLDDEA
jgi:nucleotide-binding universal stress UspA family protein